jgi:hypothetical protein
MWWLPLEGAGFEPSVPPALTMPSPGLAWRVTAVAKFLLIAIERKLRPANFAS